jgi:hypothetical protein
MNNFLRILLCIVAGVSGLAACAQYLAVVPPGTIPQDWINHAIAASVLMLAIKEGVVVIGDILDDGVRNHSFNIEKLSAKETIQDRAAKSDSKLLRLFLLMIFAGILTFMLAGCSSAARKEIGDELEASGRRVLKAGATATEAAVLEEIRRRVPAPKQPVMVNP